MILSIIASYAHDKDGARVIGKDNKMLWHFPHDLARFKEYTLGCPIIMGRKTHESIGRILPGRENIILTRDLEYQVSGVTIFHNLNDTLLYSSTRYFEAFIIGGQQLYEQSIDRTDRLYLTSFNIPNIEGDTFFPNYPIEKFRKIHEEHAGIKGDYFRILERKNTVAQEVDNSGFSPGISVPVGFVSADRPQELTLEEKSVYNLTEDMGGFVI